MSSKIKRTVPKGWTHLRRRLKAGRILIVHDIQAIVHHGACFLLIACLAHSLALKREAEGSSETSLKLYQTTRRHISEDMTLYSHFAKNMDSNNQIYSPSFPFDIHITSKQWNS
jgi:hypothetical protein